MKYKMIQGGNPHFANLDAMRFIAALLVFTSHAISPGFKFLHNINPVVQKILDISCNGGTGVQIFFVLSGFLITYLLISEHERNGKIDVRKFYMRRILRIWPLYFLVVAFSFVIYPLVKSFLGMHQPSNASLLHQLTFTSNFDVLNITRSHAASEMSQDITWSVSIEEQFYLFWPLIFLLKKRFWIFGMATVLIASTIFRMYSNTDSVVLYFHTMSVLCDLAIGGLFAFTIKRCSGARTFFENVSTPMHITFFALSFALLWWQDFLFSFPFGDAFGREFISVSFALIIVAQSMTKSKSIANLSNFARISRWGKYTYAIYLLHPIVLTLVEGLLRYIGTDQHSFMLRLFSAAVSFSAVLVIARLSYVYFESRFLAMKAKYEAK